MTSGGNKPEIVEASLKRIDQHLGAIEKSLSVISMAFAAEGPAPRVIVKKMTVSPIDAEIEVDDAIKAATLKLTLKNEAADEVECNVQVFFEQFINESKIGKPEEGKVPGFWKGKLPGKHKTTIDFALAPRLLAEMRRNLLERSVRLTVDVQTNMPMEPMGTHFLNVVVPRSNEEENEEE